MSENCNFLPRRLCLTYDAAVIDVPRQHAATTITEQPPCCYCEPATLSLSQITWRFIGRI